MVVNIPLLSGFPFPLALPYRSSQVGLILATPSKKLLEIKGISDAKLEKITEAAKRLKPTGFVTGTEALVQSKVSVRDAGGGC